MGLIFLLENSGWDMNLKNPQSGNTDGESLSNFNFFNVNTQIFQRNLKVNLSNCLETNFHDIPNISLRDIRRANYS